MVPMSVRAEAGVDGQLPALSDKHVGAAAPVQLLGDPAPGVRGRKIVNVTRRTL